MTLQLYQSHIFTDIGLKSGKKSINWDLCGHYRDLKVTLKLKLQTLNVAQINFHIFKCKIHFYEEKIIYLPFENTWVSGNQHVQRT